MDRTSIRDKTTYVLDRTGEVAKMRAARERFKSKIASHLRARSGEKPRDTSAPRDPRRGSNPSASTNHMVYTSPAVGRLTKISSSNCVTCLKNAINPAQQGPKIEDFWIAAHAGCARCAVIIRGLEKFKHFYEPEVDQDPLQHKVQVHFVSSNINVSTMGVNLRTNRVYAKRYEFCYNIEKGKVLLVIIIALWLKLSRRAQSSPRSARASGYYVGFRVRCMLRYYQTMDEYM